MTKLVLEELCSLDHERGARGLCLDIDLNLSADTSSLRVVQHEAVKFLQGVIIRLRTNIEHQRILGLDILADRLEEPFVRVDFTIVTLLDAEHEVDAAPLENLLLNAEVPGGHLEAMKQIGRNLILREILVHDVTHLFHLELLVLAKLHEALLEELLLI